MVFNVCWTWVRIVRADADDLLLFYCVRWGHFYGRNGMDIETPAASAC